MISRYTSTREGEVDRTSIQLCACIMQHLEILEQNSHSSRTHSIALTHSLSFSLSMTLEAGVYMSAFESV